MSLITISHSIGSGGVAIAQQAAGRLDLEIFDDQRLQSEAIQMGIRPEELVLLDKKAPGLLDRLLSRRPQLYLDLMEALIYKVAKSGSGVIVGHGSHFFCVTSTAPCMCGFWHPSRPGSSVSCRKNGLDAKPPKKYFANTPRRSEAI